MANTLEEFITNLQNEKNFPSDEASVKQFIVLRLISLLDWDIFNLKEVIPEYSVGGKRVDYCLKINDLSKVFIEVKNIYIDLNDSNHQKQLLSYAFEQGIKLAILTNGNTWEFYLPLTEGSWEQRKFFTIDIIQQPVSEIIKNFSDFLIKSNITSEKAFDTAKSYLDILLKQKIIGANLTEAWNKLIAEPDELLIELVNESLERISGIKAENERIAQFIQRNESRFLISEGQAINTDTRKKKTEVDDKKDSGYIRSGYSGKRIISFTFNNQNHYVGSWVEFLIKISEIIYSEKKDIFKTVETLRGRKRKYYSTNKNEVVQPGKIANTGYYVDTNLSANSIVKLVHNVLNLFGYKQESLKINYNDQ